MKARTLLSIGLRLLGVVLALRTIVYVPVLVGIVISLSLGREDLPVVLPAQWPLVASVAVAFVLTLAAAVVLLVYADALAAKFVPPDEDIDLKGWDAPSVGRTLFPLALKVVGAVCVAFAIPQIAGQGIKGIVSYWPAWGHVVEHTLPGLISFAIGIYLLKGGPLFVRLAYGRRGRSPGA